MVAKQQLGTSLLPDEDQPPATAALSAHVTAVAKQHQQGQQQRMELMVEFPCTEQHDISPTHT
jgi:hypothetical protein